MSDIKLNELRKTNTKPKRRNYVKKVEHQWSHDEIMRLIVAVQERPMLWDIGTPEYRLPKAHAWQEVVNAIGDIKVDDAKAKWMNLRISFKNNLAKYLSKKSTQGTDEAVVIHWRYFRTMMFLEANKIQQSTESTSSLPLASSTSDASLLGDFSVSSPGVEVGEQKRLENAAPLPTMSPTPSASSMREVELNAPSSRRLHDDKFSAFGNYIASELRALPLNQGAFVQRALNRELLRLLEVVETQDLPTTQHSFISSVRIVDESGLDTDSSTVNYSITSIDNVKNEDY